MKTTFSVRNWKLEERSYVEDRAQPLIFHGLLMTVGRELQVIPRNI